MPEKKKIKSFKEGYKGDDYTCWNIVMEDDDKDYEKWLPNGNRFPWKNGDIIIIHDLEEKVTDKHGTKYKIKKAKKDDAVAGGGGFNDPNIIKQMAMSYAIGLGVKFYDVFAEDVTAVEPEHVTRFAAKAYEWIIDVKPFSRDAVSRRWYAMEHTIEFAKLTGNSPEKLTDMAETFLKPVLELNNSEDS